MPLRRKSKLYERTYRRYRYGKRYSRERAKRIAASVAYDRRGKSRRQR